MNATLDPIPSRHDSFAAMRRSPGCLACASRRAANTPELAHFRLESRWSSTDNFVAWTGRTLFAAIAGQLRGRRLRIETLTA